MKQALRYIFAHKFTVIAGLLLVAVAAFFVSTNMAKASGGRDCDDNAVLKCGAYSMQEVRDKIPANHSSSSLFNRYGINVNDNNVVNGRVCRDNKVYVGNTVVAAGAITAGRHNMPGSTPWGAFFERPPSVSFRSDCLDSFVKLDGNGQFKWAIIKACGNPVRALPMPVKKPHITIKKVVNVRQVQVGQKFTYTITIKNDGEVDLRQVVVGDILPKGIVAVNHPSQPSSEKPGHQKVTWNIGNLAVGRTVTKSLIVKATAEAATGKTLVNTACVITDKNPTLPICDTADVIVRKKPVTPTDQPPVDTPPTPEQPVEEAPEVQPVASQELPNTGAGEIFLGLGGSTALGGAIQAYLRSRKGLLSFISN